MPIIKTIQKQCDFAKHSQACYHYYSAIQNDARMSSVYTCRDNNKRVNGVKTRDWRIQHAKKGWEDYLPKSYMFHDSKEPKKLACERDEWPPGYFNPPNANRPGVVAPQLVRYIPSGENGGAAQQWTSFCDLEDGGLGNGQIRKAIGARKKPPPGKKFGDINEELVRLIRPGKEKVNKGKDGKETTTTEFDAQFTRAVYEITFDKHFARFPSKENDWGLRDNPCWPKDIVPNDPGWVLLTDDAFYKTAGPLELVAELQAQKALYKLAAPKDMVQRADIRQGLNPPSKRPFDLTEDGGLAIRGVNSSRRLTHEELQRDIQIIPCADNTCSQERKLLHDDEEGLIIPGTTISPPTLPSINIDSTPTIVPRANLEIRTNTRTPLSPELPAATKNSSSHGTLRNRRVL
ncbi:hypothetical protein BU16DRAFT_578211 [Lophium mytilinum]|uniref:Uncharacterized protein n=1 Tax=Lophium mytilinum TaxID=390894 RepID=A0A6A6R6V8_9PEZI|nr:hypothetical protein BU16DRAFT_578211 [Lophium mytilinum]